MGNRRPICLVTPGHVASNPRIVKEADALQAAGYRVHVVAGWYYPAWDEADRQIYDRAEWERTTVFHLTGPRVIWAKIRRDLARRRILRVARPSLALAMRANHAAIGLLARAAAKTDAELYIGHCLPGLAAAAAAARVNHRPYSFDAEDFHAAETDYAIATRPIATSIRIIENSLLPGCRHITAASPLIGQSYADAYGVPTPTTILNVFPRSEAPPLTPPQRQPDQPPRLYWFSQTIGRGRGLENLVMVLGRMQTPCELHLRGLPAAGFMDQLQRTAADAGFHGRIVAHPTAPSDEMARLASGFDLGLSLEQNTPRNRDLCLTNKIFTYLLAGIPVALTPTHAQRQLLPELGQAGFLLDLNQPDTAASQLDAFFADPVRQRQAREAAWQLGQTRYNWELERKELLAAVEKALAGVSRPADAVTS